MRGADNQVMRFDGVRDQLPTTVGTSGGAGVVQQADPVAKKRGSAIEPHLRTFFDANRDGLISYGESFAGLRKLGVGRLAAVGAAFAINIGLGRKTQGGLLTVNLDNITDGMHGGDSDILDTDGSFVPAKLDAMFDGFAKKYGDAITREEVIAFRKDNFARDPESKSVDYVAGIGEWDLLFRHASVDRDGEKVLTKADVVRFYTDDKFFHELADRHQAKRDSRAGTLPGELANLWNTWVF